MQAPEMGEEEMGKNRKDFLGRPYPSWVLKYVEKIIESMVEGWPVPASDMARHMHLETWDNGTLTPRSGRVGSTVQGVLRDGAEEGGMAKIMSHKEPWAVFIQGFETEKGNG